MYYSHFGLSRPPFKITPDISLFYSGAERGSMLDALNYVVLSGEGITKVIGEVGSGKTMLCRMLEEKLPSQVETIYIANPSISPENILNVIAFEVGLIQQPQNKLEVMQLLQSWLLARHAANKHVVVLIEEAQGMPLETLEEIRLLSNLETEHHKLLQIVLFGQPELDVKLADSSIRQLKERIAHNFYLTPLTRLHIKDYLNFRIRCAGYHGPDLFNDKICQVIARHAEGLVRRTNIIADKTLMAAFADGTTILSPKHARKAVADSQFSKTNSRKWQPWLYAVLGLAAGLLIASLYGWFNLQSHDETPSAAAPQQKVVPQRAPMGKTKPSEPNPIKPRPAQAKQTQGSKIPANQPAANNDVYASRPIIKVQAPVEMPEAERSLDIPSSPPPAENIDENNTPEAPIAITLQTADNSSITTQSLLESRLLATKSWLEQTQTHRYSIQLMMLHESSAERLNDYLKDLPKTIDITDIFVYEANIGGKNMLGVLYQAFGTRTEASAKLQAMPGAFQRFEPFMLRSIQGIRTEIHKSSS